MRKIVAAKAAGQPVPPDFGVGQVVDFAQEALCLGLCRGEHRAEPGQDQHMRRVAPLRRRQPLQIGIELLRRLFRHMGGEHRLGVARGKAAAGVGRAGLHQHRPALRAARHVERPSHLVEVAAVVDRPDTVRLGVKPAGPVVGNRVRRPAVPQLIHHRHKFLAAGVPIGMADLANPAVIFRRASQPRGHDVPCRAAVADVIDRGKLPR